MTEDARPECCREPENLEPVEESATPGGTLTKYRCTECDRNHYVAKGDPIRFEASGSDL